ncbi:MAG: class V aminotransferase, partial [Dehalococcoidia bacterium]
LRQGGCNAFDDKKPKSWPIAFWTKEDVNNYIKKYNLATSSIYNTEKRTGCMFCMFGVHMEKGSNRFQRMKHSHPKQWEYCINKLGCGAVLDYMGIEY